MHVLGTFKIKFGPNSFRIMSDLVCDIIDHNYAMGSSVVTGSDGTKPFLPCSIPLEKKLTYINVTIIDDKDFQ